MKNAPFALAGVALIVMAVPIAVFVIASADDTGGSDFVIAGLLVALAGAALIGGVILLRRR